MRAYRQAGFAVLAAAVVAVAARLAATGSWLPRGVFGVFSFTIAELFLVPLGLLLLFAGWFIPWLRSRGVQARPKVAAKSRLSRSGLAYGCATICAALAFTVAVFPFVARRLEWGRLGVPLLRFPVDDLEDITEKTGIVIPPEAQLVEGWIVHPGPGAEVFVVIEMSRVALDEFLENQPTWEWTVDSYGAGLHPPPYFPEELAGRSEVVYAHGGRSEKFGPSVGIVAADLSERNQAVVYLYWLPP